MNRYKKCNKCQYNNRQGYMFPCDKCNPDEKDAPLTCNACRWHCDKKVLDHVRSLNGIKLIN